MNQLRFIRGGQTPSDAKLVELHAEKALVYAEDNAPVVPNISSGLWVSVDLEGGSDADIVAYKAKHYAPLLDLDRVDYYDPSDFWEPIPRPRAKQLILNPEDLYILASKERVRVPPEFAAEMVGYDPSVGEFRLHYAGFFDPGFGYGTSDDVKGAKAVLEVRSHEVPFLLEDAQPVGRLVFEQLMARPHKIYGPAIGSTYQQQDLSLSKHFKRYAPYG
jgi:dCTP deaminase